MWERCGVLVRVDGTCDEERDWVDANDLFVVENDLFVLEKDCEGTREASRITGASRSSSSSSSSSSVSETAIVSCFTVVSRVVSAGFPTAHSFLSFLLCSSANNRLLATPPSTSAFTKPAAALVPGSTFHFAFKLRSRLFGLHINMPRLLFPQTLVSTISSSLLSSSPPTGGRPFNTPSFTFCFAAISAFSTISRDIRVTPGAGRWISDMRDAFLAFARDCSRSYSARCTDRVKVCAMERNSSSTMM